MNDDHMTNASKPHVLCDAQNLAITPAKALPAACPRRRPKYLCTFGATYNHYLPGAFGLACKSTPLNLEDFPRDHLQDIMESFATVSLDAATQVTCYLPSMLTHSVSYSIACATALSTDAVLIHAYIASQELQWSALMQWFHPDACCVHAPRVGSKNSPWIICDRL